MSTIEAHSGDDNASRLMRSSILSHLEFLGYSVSSSNSDWTTLTNSSPRLWNLSLMFAEDEILFSTTVSLGAAKTPRRRAVSEALNRVNKAATATTYMLQERGGEWSVRMVMHLPPRYRREEFGAYVATWQSETDKLSLVGDAYFEGDVENDS